MGLALRQARPELEGRQIGPLLGFGVMLAPFIFSWFLLRPGYSKRSRIVCLGWMAVVIAAGVAWEEHKSGRLASELGALNPGGDQAQMQVDPQSQLMTERLARDAAEQYALMLGTGDNTQICIQAGITAQAFAQANDHANYLKWKQTERDDCLAAGLP